MEELAKGFLQYGTGGLLALIWFKLWLDERKDNRDLRKAAEASAKEYAAALAAEAAKFTARAREIEQEHRLQEDELTERLLKSVETHADNNGRMAEKVSMLVDSMRRKGE